MRNLVRFAIISLLTLYSSPSSAQSFTVSLPSIKLAAGERITAFQINISSARIASLPDTPIGWVLGVDNDPSWHTSINGNIIVGAAALDANFLRRFLRIEKEPESNEPIRLTGQLTVTAYDKTGNEHTHTVKVQSVDFHLVQQNSLSKRR
jgi:hypothetical protein